jgi:hypothetical protein
VAVPKTTEPAAEDELSDEVLPATTVTRIQPAREDNLLAQLLKRLHDGSGIKAG